MKQSKFSRRNLASMQSRCTNDKHSKFSAHSQWPLLNDAIQLHRRLVSCSSNCILSLLLGVPWNFEWLLARIWINIRWCSLRLDVTFRSALCFDGWRSMLSVAIVGQRSRLCGDAGFLLQMLSLSEVCLDLNIWTLCLIKHLVLCPTKHMAFQKIMSCQSIYIHWT